jgi:hypothetical protein
MATPDLSPVADLQRELDTHPIYAEVKTLADLRVFMAHHVFAVWDFMSLIKYLQRQVAPTTTPWVPADDAAVAYFINQLVLEEESDAIETADGVEHMSHFELYLRSMAEIGADAEAPRRFLERLRRDGLDAALYDDATPLPARYFSETTFCFIREDKPHAAAAALAVGREQIIPGHVPPAARGGGHRCERCADLPRLSELATSIWTRTSTARCPCGCWSGCATATRAAHKRPAPRPKSPSAPGSGSGTGCWRRSARPAVRLGREPKWTGIPHPTDNRALD